MSSDALGPVGPPEPQSSRPVGVQGTEAGQFARVYQLEEARRRRATGPDRIPEEVWDDMHRANELFEALDRHGQQVRFETHRLTGRVVASLVDTEGNVVRPMGLREAVGVPEDPLIA